MGISQWTNEGGARAVAAAFPEYPCTPIKVKPESLVPPAELCNKGLLEVSVPLDDIHALVLPSSDEPSSEETSCDDSQSHANHNRSHLV